MRRESRLEGAWTHACCALINGKRLALVQANRDLLESLLNPGEEPSAKLYIALAQQYPQRFAWSSPPKTQSDEERRADFALICRQNNLSECIANEKLHKSGVGIEHWAGASRAEGAAYAEQAALQRNKWLRTEASPLELRAEAQLRNSNSVSRKSAGSCGRNSRSPEAARSIRRIQTVASAYRSQCADQGFQRRASQVVKTVRSISTQHRSYEASSKGDSQ